MLSLSEAIRLGATLGPQARGSFVLDARDGQTASCALGSAALAAGMAQHELSGRFPVLLKFILPEHRNFVGGQLLTLILYLNDGAGLTRDEIADLVEQYETKPAPAEVQQEVCSEVI